MGKYKLINNVLGWVVFLIASTVYLMTMEPTASFWDCGEFISSAYKLEVGHPPGAPFFMLTANLFTQFASDPSKVAVMVNTMSALFSGLTILFLFWSITHLARKIIVEDDKMMCLGQMITIMGCGLVGSFDSGRPGLAGSSGADAGYDGNVWERVACVCGSGG